MAEFPIIEHEIGDGKSIHKMTSIPEDTIYSILQGKRNCNTPTGERILKALENLL
ncbi:MAG: hypothetical protein ACLGGV_07920 [Bacteroidia bacterium]